MRIPLIDLGGQTFGRLTAVERAGGKVWRCRCVCGGTKEATTGNLRAGNVTSCGCLLNNRRRAIKDEFVGKTFDYLTPIDFADQWVICRCVCGKITRVRPRNLRLSEVKSCGCKRAELIGGASKTYGQSRHGARTPEYTAWTHMKQRCCDPEHVSYSNYGGRGIAVHASWLDNFEEFFEHVGRRPSPKHSIDRIDNNGNYAPGNVRWATTKQQNRNTRRIKLDEIDLILIRHWIERGYSQKSIAMAFNVHKAHIANINCGYKWASDS